MTMHLKKKIPLQLSSSKKSQPAEEEQATATEPCHCTPLSSLHTTQKRGSAQEEERLVSATPELNSRLRTHLQNLLSHIDTLSIILLHVSQIEPPPIVPPSILPPRHQHYHVSDSFLDQLMMNVRRAIREDDTILLQPGSGAALVLPNVDAQGTYCILERIHHSLDLLQGETVIPPLTRETTILLGSGSYPEQGKTAEQLLYATGTVLHHLTLRSALAPQSGRSSSFTVREQKRHISNDTISSPAPTNASAPFMRLPTKLPWRLKQLIPYHLAQELNCAPVGKDHHCLTVAMANPADRDAVHYLEACTGMTIFPVSCEEDALLTLLKKPW